MKNPIVRKIVKYVLIAAIIAGAGTGGYYIYKTKFAAANAKASNNVIPVKVTKGELDVTITGTGTVEPMAKYDIVALVKGNILQAPFEEGMQVKKGDLLYKIDDSDLSYNIQKAQNAITKQQISNQQTVKSVNNMEVYAPAEGRISNLTLKEGEQVNNNGKIAEIIDDKHITATIPFSAAQIDKIKVGQKALLTSSDYMGSLDGTVSNVSTSAKPSSGGGLTYDVEIAIDNPGALAEGMLLTAVVQTAAGEMSSVTTGAVSYSKSRSVIAEASGKIKQIYVKNDEWVKAGQKLMTLENDDLKDTINQNALNIKDSQLSLESQMRQLDDYNILSPIDGTVTVKNYKVGDTVGNSSDSKTLMTVADLSKMKFNISVDELDIAKVSVGQKVAVTADALEGEKFEGEITKVPMEGTTSNGVTTYSVEVTIPNPGKLKPGMNVNAEIKVQSKNDVLMLPVDAVTKVGDKSFVFVKGNNSGTGTDKKQDASQSGSANSQNGTANSTGRQRAQGNTTGNGQNRGQRLNGSNASGSPMAGYQRKEVVTGISNDTSIEIVSGINEGDTVYQVMKSSGSSTNFQFGGPPGGGMMAIPGGGTPGGRTTTGGNRNNNTNSTNKNNNR